MSMRSYGFEDYGLLLSEETLNIIAKKACKDYDDKTYYTTYELVDLIEENDKMPFVIDYVSEFSGSAFELCADGYDLDTDKNYDGDTVYYIALKRSARLWTKAYNSIKEVIDELEDKTFEYLPIDFDYEGNLRHFVGSYLG